MATDAVSEYGMQMAKISDETKAKLRSFLPAAASVKNPIDMIASAPIEHYKQTLETVIAKNPQKPVIGVFMTTNEFFSKLSDMNVNMPFFMYAEEAADGLNRLNQQRLWMEQPAGKIPCYDVDKAKVEKIIKASIAEGRDQLTTLESIDVLQAYGIRACKYGLATNEEEVVNLGNAIGYPVVMKMTSKTTSHKTDVGGVRVNIQSEEQLRAEYKDLIQKLTEKGLIEGLEGVIIQEMVKGNREMVCGIATDPQYGPMMMFGLGGVFVEALKDVTFRIAPLTDLDAKDMIKSVKAYKLLQGARGTKPAQMEQIEETLLRLSQLVNDFKFIDELDINPLLISEKTGEGIAVDGRIKVRLEEAKKALNSDCTACACQL